MLRETFGRLFHTITRARDHGGALLNDQLLSALHNKVNGR
jgi:hypothetical protein